MLSGREEIIVETMNDFKNLIRYRQRFIENCTLDGENEYITDYTSNGCCINKLTGQKRVTICVYFGPHVEEKTKKRKENEEFIDSFSQFIDNIQRDLDANKIKINFFKTIVEIDTYAQMEINFNVVDNENEEKIVFKPDSEYGISAG